MLWARRMRGKIIIITEDILEELFTCEYISLQERTQAAEHDRL